MARASLPISVVVPTKNRPDGLERLLQSLCSQLPRPQEIIVVDDGSERPARPSLPPMGAPGIDLHVIRHERSRGACASRNAGWRRASGEFVAFFDDDAELSGQRGLERAMHWMRQRRCGAVGFRQTDAAGRTRGVNPSDATSVVLAPVFFTYGCLMNRSALENVGGFPEAFGYYEEEVEVSLRLLDADYDIVYDPAIAVVHHEDSAGRNWQRISRLSFRNSLLTVLCNYPIPLVFPGIARAAFNSTRGFSGRVGWDIVGKIRAVVEAAGMSGFVLARREPVKWESLLRMRNLRRAPVLLAPAE